MWMVTGLVLVAAVPSLAVESGPVDRKWGMGWDDGLTARLWLRGTWELGVAAGPNDNLRNTDRSTYDTGSPPLWEESQENTLSDDRTESGFVRAQAGRLLARRGPLAAVCFLGLEYAWSDGGGGNTRTSVDLLDNSYTESWDNDSSAWTLTLGLRPSFEILGFLTIETAFALEYRWLDSQWVDRIEYPDTGRVLIDVQSGSGNRFDDAGWTGTGSLQFFIWF